MRYGEIKPDIFDINRDMPMGPDLPSLPFAYLTVTVVLYPRPHFFRVHIIYQIGLKLIHNDHSIVL